MSVTFARFCYCHYGFFLSSFLVGSLAWIGERTGGILNSNKRDQMSNIFSICTRKMQALHRWDIVFFICFLDIKVSWNSTANAERYDKIAISTRHQQPKEASNAISYFIHSFIYIIRYQHFNSVFSISHQTSCIYKYMQTDVGWVRACVCLFIWTVQTILAAIRR